MDSIVRHTDGSIDWDAIQSKLRQTKSDFESDQLTAEQRQAILKARASVLARVPEQSPDMQQLLQLLTFQIGNETFGIETKYVSEVVSEYRAVSIPDAPSFVVGVANLRGEILAVMDLRDSFGISLPRGDGGSPLVVLGLDRTEFGVVTDSVHDVCTIRTDQVLEVPHSIIEPGRRYLRGVTTDAMLVLDGILLLEDQRFYVDLDD